MKKVFCLFFLQCALLSSYQGLSYASEWKIYTQVQNFRYVEFADSGEILDREYGFLYGLGGDGLLHLPYNVNLHGDGEFAYGVIDYDGQTQSGIPLTTDTEEFIWRNDIDAQLRIPVGGEFAVSPLIGLGYRYWFRSIKSTGSIIGIDETYQIAYYKAGLKTDYARAENSFTLEGGIRYPYYSEIEVDLSDFGFGKPNLDLGKKTNYYLEGIFSLPLNETVDLFVTLFYENWRFGRSETRTVTGSGSTAIIIYEPRSDTEQFGFKAGIEF